MDEKLIERKLVKLARQSGGLALKFTSPGFDGVPDRLLLFPGGIAAFAEIKTTGKKPRPLQMSRKRQLEKLGFEVSKVLVIAPLRVATNTWPTEIGKWDHMHGMTYSVAVGTEAERKAALAAKADIYIINRENVQWLIEIKGAARPCSIRCVGKKRVFANHGGERGALRIHRKIHRTAGRAVQYPGDCL